MIYAVVGEFQMKQTCLTSWRETKDTTFKKRMKRKLTIFNLLPIAEIKCLAAANTFNENPK
jgi:hypothetical protein